MSNLQILIGEYLRNARVERKLSQDQLAEMTGFTRPRISMIENGGVNLQLKTLEVLLEALEIPQEELFNFNSLFGKTDIKDKTIQLQLLHSVLRERGLDDIEYVLNTAANFFETVDAKKKK